MDYPLMETPFILVPFYEMNKKQASEYFDWFIEIKDDRITQLEAYAQEERRDLILDKTPESLVSLWEWFQEHIEWEDKSVEELQQELIGDQIAAFPYLGRY